MWLNRGDRRYFYLSKRINGRPRAVYVGTGFYAELLAAEVEHRKLARQANAEACAVWKDRARSAEEPLDALCAGLDQVVTASLLALGYHRHDRSKWRKRREHREVQTQ